MAGLEIDGVDAGRELWRLPEVSYEADGTPYTHDRTVTPDEWIDDLLNRDLTTKDATFTRAELYQAVAHRLGDGATVTTIDRIANRVLASAQVLPIHEPGIASGAERWTSRAMAATERRLLDTFHQHDTRAPVAAPTIAFVLTNHPTLGADQRNAVEVVAGSTDPVSVLIGPAGTGKTYTLAVVREAYEAAGFRLIGAAPSARAACRARRRRRHGHPTPCTRSPAAGTTASNSQKLPPCSWSTSPLWPRPAISNPSSTASSAPVAGSSWLATTANFPRSAPVAPSPPPQRT